MNYVLIVLKLLPAVIEAMKAIEAAIPGQGKGEQKLAASREIVQVVDEKANEYWPGIEKAIGVLVKLFNTVGVFKKG